MSAKIKYTDEPLGKLQVVLDFLPPHEELTFREDDVKDRRLVVERPSRPRYGLDKSLAQCDASAKLTAEDREWLDAKPVGKELL